MDLRMCRSVDEASRPSLVVVPCVKFGWSFAFFCTRICSEVISSERCFQVDTNSEIWTHVRMRKIRSSYGRCYKPHTAAHPRPPPPPHESPISLNPRPSRPSHLSTCDVLSTLIMLHPRMRMCPLVCVTCRVAFTALCIAVVGNTKNKRNDPYTCVC